MFIAAAMENEVDTEALKEMIAELPEANTKILSQLLLHLRKVLIFFSCYLVIGLFIGSC
jgi:hypothetical protein